MSRTPKFSKNAMVCDVFRILFWEFISKRSCFYCDYYLILLYWLFVDAHACENCYCNQTSEYLYRSIRWATKPRPENITDKNNVFCEARTVNECCFFEWRQRSSFINYLLRKRETSPFYYFFCKRDFVLHVIHRTPECQNCILGVLLFSTSQLIMACAEACVCYRTPHMMRPASLLVMFFFCVNTTYNCSFS